MALRIFIELTSGEYYGMILKVILKKKGEVNFEDNL